MLLLPQGIAERLSPSEMNAILAHELCHVRRRVNLLALIHMIVVVSRGNAPDLYAEAIVKVCISSVSPCTPPRMPTTEEPESNRGHPPGGEC